MSIPKYFLSYEALFESHRLVIEKLIKQLPSEFVRKRKLGPLQVILTLMASHFTLSSVKGQPWADALADVARDFGEALGWDPEQSIARQSFHDARRKLTPEIMEEVWLEIVTLLSEDADLQNLTRVNGIRFMHVDGSQFYTENSEELVRQFGVQTNGKNASCHYPHGQLVTIIEGGTGALVGTHVTRCKKKDDSKESDLTMGERSGLNAILHLLEENDCIVGDAGFFSYRFVYDEHKAGRLFMIALSKSLAIVKAFKKHRKSDAVITYTIPNNHTDKTLRGRQICVRIFTIKGCDGKVKYIMTNIMSDQLTRTQARRVYKQRWSIEVFFRNAKTHLGMRQMRSRTLAGVRQELFAIMAFMRIAAHLQSTITTVVNAPKNTLDIFTKGFKKTRVHMTFKYTWQILIDAMASPENKDRNKLARIWSALIKTMQKYMPGRRHKRITHSPVPAFKEGKSDRKHRKTKGNKVKSS